MMLTGTQQAKLKLSKAVCSKSLYLPSPLDIIAQDNFPAWCIYIETSGKSDLCAYN